MTTEDGPPSGQTGFDLLDRPWIPLLGTDGTVSEYSLPGAFRAAGNATQIVGEIPTQSFALLRLMLAILHRASGPRDLRHWTTMGENWDQTVDTVAAYLDRFRDRFDLFHPATPFFQVHDLTTSGGKASGLEKLIVDVPNGAPLFSTRVGPGLERLSAAEAARWLVHVQAFDPSGIRSGDLRDGRVKNGKGYPIGPGWCGEIGGVHLEGRTLAATLLLNLGLWGQYSLTVQMLPEDLPPWEEPPHTAVVDGRSPVGPVGAYTWQARRVRLVRDGQDVTGVVLCQGEKLTPHNRQTIEPMTVWRHSEPQSKKLGGVVYMPRRLDPNTSLWRGLAAVLPGQEMSGHGKGPASTLPPDVIRWSEQLLYRGLLPGTEHVDLHAVGLAYGTQDSVVTDLVDDRLTLPVHLLAPEAEAWRSLVTAEIAAAEKAVKALWALAVDLAAAGGAGKDERKGPAGVVRERGYDVLGRAYREWLALLGSDEDREAAITRWRRGARTLVLALADELVAACPPAAWAGRSVDGRYLDVGAADRFFRSALNQVLPPDRDDSATLHHEEEAMIG